MKKHIYFTGFMGAGKSRLGRELAARISWPIIDTDKVIEEQEQKTVSEIFKAKGESFFRDKEKQILSEISKSEQPMIIALGGGMLKNPDNFKLASQSGLIIYIQSSPEAILERIRHTDKRPLLRGKSDMEKLNLIREMLEKRKAVYEKAHIVFNRDGYELEELLVKLERVIMKHIKEANGNGYS